MELNEIKYVVEAALDAEVQEAEVKTVRCLSHTVAAQTSAVREVFIALLWEKRQQEH